MKPFWKVVFGGCLGTIIAFLLVNLIFFGVIGSLVSSLGKEEQPSVPRNAILKIDLRQSIQEQGKESFSFNPLAGSASMSSGLSLLDAIRALDAAAEVLILWPRGPAVVRPPLPSNLSPLPSRP